MGYATSVIASRSRATQTPVTRIDVPEALRRFRRGDPIVFVDARRDEEWRCATDKLPGAMRLAPDRADDTLPIIPVFCTAVVYCTSRAQASSVTAASLLASRGYEAVRVLDGGLSAWRQSGGPMEPV
jgi:rhodanese-related sulfurtransferase